MKMYRSNGIECKYFVLNPRSKKTNDSYARASRKAMEAYAQEIFDKDPDLANSLLRWVDSEGQGERMLPLEEGALYSRWIERLVPIDSAGKRPNHKWNRVIKCESQILNETLSFFRRANPDFKYRIRP